jgi:RNA-directed DNA polymerase
MNVIKNEIKDRQLHIEGYLQRLSAEQKEYAEASAHSRITDCMIFCKSKKSAVRTLENIMPYIEGKLFLKVNREKTKVAHVSKVKYLGYSFYRYKGKCRLRVHPKSIVKMKAKLKELTSRNNGWGNEYRALKLTQFIRGWVNYFAMADMKQLLKSTDE